MSFLRSEAPEMAADVQLATDVLAEFLEIEDGAAQAALNVITSNAHPFWSGF